MSPVRWSRASRSANGSSRNRCLMNWRGNTLEGNKFWIPSVSAGKEIHLMSTLNQAAMSQIQSRANGTAVRRMDMHVVLLAADYSHPGEKIPPILAVAQAMKRSGKDLIRGIAAGYEIQIDLVKAICLHRHRIDHIAHLCPAQAGGIGALLGLPVKTIYQAVQQAVHVSFTTRQSRKGEISSWKAFAPAHAGKLPIEA